VTPLDGSTAIAAFDEARQRVAGYRPEPVRRRVAFDLAELPLAARPEVGSAASVHGTVGPLSDAARDLRAGRTSAVALVEAAIAAAEKQVLPDALAARGFHAALVEARRLDDEAEVGRWRGPLHGIPVTVKDVIDVAGLDTRCGSDAYLDRPTRDASSVAALRAAGAVVIAKAVTHEFALGVTCPQLRNPHDPDRIPGGSSGGSVVSLVEGIGLASLGTDTRASIRTPAALTGAVGFKPTYGRIATDGVVSLSWTMDHVAPMAMSVGDAAVVLDVLLGTTDLAAAATAGSTSDIAGTRIGVPVHGLADAEPGVAGAVRNALEALSGAGGDLVEVVHPDLDDLADANMAGLLVSRCEAAGQHRSFGLDRSLYWAEVREQLAEAETISAMDYLDAQRMRGELRDRFLRQFESVDVLVMPTSPVVAPPADRFAEYLLLLSRNAIPWSFVGFPAISVPVGRSEGLPVGLQVVAPPHAEARVARVAAALEAALR
jgi:aspartyl-tRNA(Asn)/glutamyl-tRNA(Gln) amidotransferase subunit A